MTSNVTGSIDRKITPDQQRLKASPDRWLSLAAAPTFAIMALLTAAHGGGMQDMLCSAAPDASPLTGMVTMYTLMSAFHLAPWLRLLSRLKPMAERLDRECRSPSTASRTATR
jgi:hypothetical protein